MLLVQQKYQSSFDIAMHCALECEHCAQMCMGNPDMAKCARLCLDCAEICRTAATFMVRGSYFVSQLAWACAEICQICQDECNQHDALHCQKCARVCYQAVEAYRKIAGVGVVPV